MQGCKTLEPCELKLLHDHRDLDDLEQNHGKESWSPHRQGAQSPLANCDMRPLDGQSFGLCADILWSPMIEKGQQLGIFSLRRGCISRLNAWTMNSCSSVNPSNTFVMAAPSSVNPLNTFVMAAPKCMAGWIQFICELLAGWIRNLSPTVN